jgi:hypothetical protein
MAIDVRLWYPFLLNFSKTKIFEGLATEAVEECTITLLNASRTMAARVLSYLSFTYFLQSPLDAKMFLIKHLLILREQIGKFDVNFSFTESTLDFSHMRGIPCCTFC